MTPLEPFYAQTPTEERPAIRRHPLHLVLDNFRSAYNVGSAFRTADACGIEHIHLCGMSAHPPHKKIEKTALGAFDYVPWTYYERTGDAIDALRALKISIVAIETVRGAVAYTTLDWPKPVAAVFGNEVAGIPDKILHRCDATAVIPMRGYKNSINVATAVGIVAYEILRRWGEL